MKVKFSKDDTTLDMALKAIECVKQIEHENGLTDEEINIRFTSGNCGYLAEDVVFLIKSFCEEEKLSSKGVRLYQCDTKAGPHCYIRVPDPACKEEDPILNKGYLYVDISGVYNHDQMLERNQSNIFEEANQKVASGQVREYVVDHARLDDTLSKLFQAVLPQPHEKEKGGKGRIK